MQRIAGTAPFPTAMQGRWVDVNDPGSEMVIRGGEVVCFGAVVQYDYKELSEVDGAVTVSLKIWDSSAEDGFQRASITGLVIDPEGRFHAYNVKFVGTFVRPRDQRAE